MLITIPASAGTSISVMSSSLKRYLRPPISKNFFRACPHFENGDKNEINCSQTKKIAQVISGY